MSHNYSYDVLYSFVKKIFAKIGCSEIDAETATITLLSADLRGVDSHGIARLSGYVRLWEAKRINANPGIKIVHETPSTAVVDGDKGLGLVVAPFAMKVAIDKAMQAGTGWVSVKNSNHFGIAGIHAMMALKYDMTGIAMTNASALVAPTFSSERLLGTNPIAVAIPAGKEQPLLFQVVNNRFQKWNSILHIFFFKLCFGLTGHIYTIFPFNRDRVLKSMNPLIHMKFKFIRRPEGINSHGTKKVANAFARHIIRHGNIGGKRRHPWAIVSATKHCRENINNCSQGVTLMASMLPVSAEWQQRSRHSSVHSH